MSTTETPRAVLGFTAPESLRPYALLTVWADTPSAFEELRATLLDAGHSIEISVLYSNSAKSFTVMHWTEGAVACSCHGPYGYKAER